MMEIAKMTNAPCPLRAIQSVTPRRVSAALTIVLEVCAYYIFDLVEKWRFFPRASHSIVGHHRKVHVHQLEEWGARKTHP